jgi:hypothetical protein
MTSDAMPTTTGLARRQIVALLIKDPILHTVLRGAYEKAANCVALRAYSPTADFMQRRSSK